MRLSMMPWRGFRLITGEVRPAERETGQKSQYLTAIYCPLRPFFNCLKRGIADQNRDTSPCWGGSRDSMLELTTHRAADQSGPPIQSARIM
jgi:hypothetical protein